jgi:hypothetical protein
MVRNPVPWAVCATCILAADLTPETIRLARIRFHMSQNLTRVPNYTCTQTIERSSRRFRGRKFQLLDTLRLEVALVNGNEMFAWPGSGKFEDKRISDIVGGGTIGNGSFAGHARAVFMSGAPRFDYEGEQARPGGTVYRYRYSVPVLLSNYEIKIGDVTGKVGFSGYFESDARTLEPKLLEVKAEEIPSALRLQSATSRMVYKAVRIGEKDFSLPETSELIMVDFEGNEHRNLTTLSGCREYTGESVLRFDEPTEESAPPVAIAGEVDLPAGLVLESRLETPLVPAKTAIGDPVEALLIGAAKHKGRVMVPKGARLHARLVKLEKGFARTEFLRVLLNLEQIEFPGAKAPVSAILVEAGPIVARNLRISVDREGRIWLSGNQPEVGRGTRLVWRIENKATR